MSPPKHVDPAISEKAFNCPHCGAFAKQFWWQALADDLHADNVPLIVMRDKSNVDLSQFKAEQRAEIQKWIDRMAAGAPFLDTVNKNYADRNLGNVFIAECFNCKDISLWIYDKMIWPVRGNAPTPNPDLPADVRADFDEAATIADLSPRGAAALLRLCVQKLCVALGGKGKDINADIASLVSEGLDPRVQQALDVVRVIGNNAVHPGQLDLKDDRATASKLFSLINLIADIMISQPNHVSAMFDSLPQGARKAIEQRDKKGA